MIQLKHFVITLFNLNLYKRDKSLASVHTEEWLAGRFQLFDTYCFPSMKAQTSGDYIWLCLFDADTPEKYKQRIRAYENVLPQFRPCFLTWDQTLDWKEHVRNVVSSCLSAGDEYIVTTKLDNDDAFHSATLATLQTMICEQPQEGLYNFVDGLQYFVSLDMVLKMRYPHNHFPTLCEKNSTELKTIINYSHEKARKLLDNVIDIKGKPYWVEVVHDRNMNNDLRIASRIKYSSVTGEFSLKDYGLDIHFPASRNALNTYVKWPLLFIRTGVQRMVYKVQRKMGMRKQK